MQRPTTNTGGLGALRRRVRSLFGGAARPGAAPVPLPAIPITTETPSDARTANLLAVVSALEVAHIPYVMLRAERAVRSVLSVRAAHLDDLVRAIGQTDMMVGIVREGMRHPEVVRADEVVSAIGDPDDVELLRVFREYAHQAGELIYGRDYACDVEIWRPAEPEGWWRGPRPNAISSVMHESDLEPISVPVGDRSLPMAKVCELRSIDDVDFPIDAVYLWVDGNDPEWQQRMRHARGEMSLPQEAAGAHRFRTFDELRYSLRSLHMYAPWIRRVHIVTDRQVPACVRDDSDIVIVDHSDIVPAEYLPLFNSDAISSFIHRVPGLSEHFIYLNDDVFFGASVFPSTFFAPSGLIKVFPSTNQRPTGPVHPDDSLANAKAKHVRALIEQRYERTVSYMVRHTAHALTLSMMELVEREFADDIERTRRQRFRTSTDVPIEQLVHYVSQIIGTGFPTSLKYGYATIGAAAADDELGQLRSMRDREMFCINDDGGEVDEALFTAVLDAMYPLPSRWERL